MKSKNNPKSFTLREADKVARRHGFKRGPGTYNGAVYWRNRLGQIVTKQRLEDLR